MAQTVSNLFGFLCSRLYRHCVLQCAVEQFLHAFKQPLRMLPKYKKFSAKQ